MWVNSHGGVNDFLCASGFWCVFVVQNDSFGIDESVLPFSDFYSVVVRPSESFSSVAMPTNRRCLLQICNNGNAHSILRLSK